MAVVRVHVFVLVTILYIIYRLLHLMFGHRVEKPIDSTQDNVYEFKPKAVSTDNIDRLDDLDKYERAIFRLFDQAVKQDHTMAYNMVGDMHQAYIDGNVDEAVDIGMQLKDILFPQDVTA